MTPPARTILLKFVINKCGAVVLQNESTTAPFKQEINAEQQIHSDNASPYDGLTREQAATFLYRFSNHINCSFSTGGPNASSFVDYNKVSDYARATMNWATTRKLINGSAGSNGKLYLLPQSYLQRDQAAQLIYNYATRGYH